MDEPEFDEPEESFDSFAPGPEDEPLFDAPAAIAPAPSPTASTAPAPLALYRRYRPDTFADVIGQDHVTEPLQRALTNNRVNHAYLFSGPRGCGKTTSARILARALNCELGPRAEPCGECQSCRDLARGGPGSIDVIEIDAASHGGVDDARDLRERAFFAPVASRYKIYIVDEAHMVTTAGFNALLKLVEEPPPHVKFIFATTEPDKVIGTIRSRTHHYPFRLVPPRVLSDYLAKLCAAEGIPVEPVVLPLVVRAGAGSVRDSLSVLDQLLGGAGESGVSYSQATALLGYTPDSLLDEFMDAFAAGDAGGVFACVDKVIEVGQDPRRFAEDLLRRLRDLVIVAAVSDALTSGLVEVAPDQADRLSSQAAALGAGELTRAAEVMAAGLTDMRGTTAPRLHLELMCARVLLPGADVDDRGIHARLDRLERRAGMTGAAAAPRPEPTAARPEPTAATPEPASTFPEPVEGPRTASRPEPTSSTDPGPTSSSPEPTSTLPEPVEGLSTTTLPEPTTTLPEPTTTLPEPVEGPPTPTPTADPPGQAPTSRPSAAKQAEDRQGPAGGESDDTALGSTPDKDAGSPMSVVDVRRLWPEVLEEVKGKRRFTWILLSQNAQVAEVRNGNLLLSMANVGARDSFSRGGSEDVLKEALIVVLGVDFKIDTMVEGGTGSPPPARPGPVSDDAARSWNNPAPAPAEAPAPSAPPAPSPADPSSSDTRVREQARQSIRPTRQGQSVGSANDERDSAATLNDSDLEESTESHTELLARHLGAEIIAEEEHGA